MTGNSRWMPLDGQVTDLYSCLSYDDDVYTISSFLCLYSGTFSLYLSKSCSTRWQ